MNKQVIKLRQSSMPSAEELMIYLRKIDANRIYSNRGFLLNDFENRIAETLNVNYERIVALSNGTSALELALKTSPKPNLI